jgi:endonuclease G
MKKTILISLLCLSFINALSQKISWDTIIYNDAYASYYSSKYKNPVFVAYKLYKGGGPCSRAKFRFKNDLNIQTATDKDYLHSGFDKGHLANSEDFAFNCPLDEITFRYYNCVPQYPELNRGIWKSNEEEIRKISQNDSILIVCLNIFDAQSKKIGNSLYVPTSCVKIVYSLSSNKVIMVRAFTNSKTPTSSEKSIDWVKSLGFNEYESLKRKLKTNIP